MAKCTKCGGKAVIEMRYGPHNFCASHFKEFFERRVRKSVRKFRMVKDKEHVAVALSGGKDSVATLQILHNILNKKNKISAIGIDEGVKGYRDKALAVARKNCEELGVDYYETSFEKEFGITLTEVMDKIGVGKEQGTSCSYCGVFRRKLINQLARNIKAKKVATGHNLDDECQSITMNIFDGDLSRLARLGPVSKVGAIKGFVPRIKPLYETPEDEVIKYVEVAGIEAYVNKCCPYRWQAKRNSFRKMLDDMEETYPGTKFSILRSFLGMKALFRKERGKGNLKFCKECGEPTSTEVCGACRQLARVKGGL